jgi:predicted ATPase/transcriptional regulator with XRE-family HTH domain
VQEAILRNGGSAAEEKGEGMNDSDAPVFFGEWLKRQRQRLDLTQAELAERAGCSVFALRKIEAGERRPSKQLAALLAGALQIPANEQESFMRAARGEAGCAQMSAAPSASPQAPAQEEPDALLHNWPPRATPLVGREDELASLGHLLAEPLCRLLTLIGPGGIGKTRLAVAAGERVAASFADGAWFIPLAPVAAPAAVIPALAEALALTLRGQVEPRRQLLDHLAGKQALLVVDNLEHLLAAAGLLADILAHAPGAKLIATSRERLNLQSEYVFVTQGLPTPPPDQVHRGHDYDAIRLFAQAAQRAGAGVALQGEELAAAAQVCRLVEGMPLGVELAAAWTPLLSCQEIAQEIQRSLDFLTTSLRDLPERQRSLRAVFDHSWRLLTGEERAALARLAIFQGGFTRAAAATVAGASLPILLSLASKSLIRRTESGAYDLHEVVRQYAYAYLCQMPDCAETCDRHSRFYLARLYGQEPALHSRDQRQVLRSLIDAIDNLRAAWDWAVAQGKFDAIGPALRAFGCLFELSGWLDEGIRLLETVIQAAEGQLEEALWRRLAGEALAQQALLLMRQGHFGPSLQRANASLDLVRPLADPDLLVRPLIFRSIIQHMAGALDESEAAVVEARACALQVGDRWGATYADFLHGYVIHLRGDHQAGYAQMRGSVEQWRSAGDPHTRALGLNFFGPVAVQLGRFAEAEASLQEALELGRQLGDRWSIGTSLRFLGLAALAQGDAAQAQELLRQSLDVHRGAVAGWDIARTLIYLAAALGDSTGARAILGDALTEAQAADAPALVLDALVARLALMPSDELGRAAGVVAFALAHPACSTETQAQLAALWAALAVHLPEEACAAARAWATAQPLTVLSLLRFNRDAVSVGE